jgi:hypothetical protein
MSNAKSVLLSTAYLAPIDYYVQLLYFDQVSIEAEEHFLKQSYRNRCRIAGANGPLSLSVPVVRKSKDKTKISDIKISYTENWQAQHWKTICSCYESSPFFEYYKDALYPYFSTKKFDSLLELNSSLQEHIASEIGLHLPFQYTDSYQENIEDSLDLRQDIHPKREHYSGQYQSRYIQVFDSKFGFQAGMSIIDLLFNEGPNTENYLQKTMNKQYSHLL